MRCTHCSEVVRPVVALDIDGTMGDYFESLFTFAEMWLGRGWQTWAFTYDGTTKLARHMGIGDEEYRAMKLAYRQGGGKRMMPIIPGAHMLSHALRREGVEVWITTTRPYNRFDSTDPDTREWLRRHDVYYDHLIYDDDKYARLLESVDRERVVAVLEDLGDNYDRAEQLGLRPILAGSKYNRGIHRDVKVGSLAQAQELIINHYLKAWRFRHDPVH